MKMNILKFTSLNKPKLIIIFFGFLVVLPNLAFAEIPSQAQPLIISTQNDNLQPTYDLNLAKTQVSNFVDNPEAHFILGVALTRNNDIENAFKEMHTARKLAANQGGLGYFDKVINEYENMLIINPQNNSVRYSLAWAFYMKAYILKKAGKESKLLTSNQDKWEKSLAHESQDPEYYYKKCQEKLQDIINLDPRDTCSKIYNTYLEANITGNFNQAIKSWNEISNAYPDNPAPYFFLGEVYLKQGNVKLSLQNISKAIALRKNNTKNN